MIFGKTKIPFSADQLIISTDQLIIPKTVIRPNHVDMYQVEATVFNQERLSYSISPSTALKATIEAARSRRIRLAMNSNTQIDF